MASMIERIARAMLRDEMADYPRDDRNFEDVWEDEGPIWLRNARAAIEAMMECTDEMEQAGVDEFYQYEFPSWAIPEIWKAMLTAALAVAPGEG